MMSGMLWRTVSWVLTLLFGQKYLKFVARMVKFIDMLNAVSVCFVGVALAIY